jgi:hypothetical protein
MADVQLPYVTSYGNITKALKKIQSTATPDRFTQDFLATKLGLKGGSPRPVIPFLKRTGFLNSDGTPTALYKRFRNPSQRGAAAAEALRRGYARIYDSNEYAHELTGPELRGLVIEVTGMDETSSTFKAVIGSFNALKAFADFAAEEQEEETPKEEKAEDEMRDEGFGEGRIERLPAGVNLGYTINLHLPATSDIAVFNAIFKSLREHILRS